MAAPEKKGVKCQHLSTVMDWHISGPRSAKCQIYIIFLELVKVNGEKTPKHLTYINICGPPRHHHNVALPVVRWCCAEDAAEAGLRRIRAGGHEGNFEHLWTMMGWLWMTWEGGVFGCFLSVFDCFVLAFVSWKWGRDQKGSLILDHVPGFGGWISHSFSGGSMYILWVFTGVPDAKACRSYRNITF